jgi:DNA helicase MCM9
MRYYQMQRQSEDRSSARTTVRLLESLMRLSEAHARLVCRPTVAFEDAVMAIYLMSLTQTQTSFLENTSTLQSDFPTDSQNAYLEIEEKVLGIVCTTKSQILKEATGNAYLTLFSICTIYGIFVSFGK